MVGRLRFGALGLGLTLKKGAAALVLPTFAYNPATIALAAAFTTPPTARRKKTIDWAINTLQGANYEGANPWAKLLGFWKVGQDQQSSFVNWVTPGTYNLTVSGPGSPAFTANSQIAPAASTVLDTGIPLNVLNLASCSLFVQTRTGTSSASDAGGLDGSGNGLTLCVFSTGSSAPTARCGGANVTTGFGTGWSVEGIAGISRTGGTAFSTYRGGVPKNVITNSNATTVATSTIGLLGVNNAGALTAAGRPATCWAIGAGLTAAEAKVLANVMYELDAQFTYGEVDEYQAGFQPQNLTYDLVIYGATSQGVIAAYAAKRAGLNVAIVGGYRERLIGGMSGGGLGFADWNNQAGLGGLPLWVLAQIQAIQSTASFNFECRYFRGTQQGMVDPRITGGLDIPVYWSNGVASVAKSNASGNPRITSMTTADGRVFTAAYFEDWSYEGDLGRVSGIPMTIGREATTTYSESAAGYQGIGTSFGNNANQYQNASAALITVDPYVSPGVPSSGLISGVTGTYTAGTPAVGSADGRVQNYNFRLMLTTTAAELVPFPSTPPVGYSASTYEALGRQFLNAGASPITFADIFHGNAVHGNVYDFNNGTLTGMSTDLMGGAQAYPSASYAARAAIWSAHWGYILGLFYYLQYDPDSRVPSAVRTTALTYGFHARHFTRPPDITTDFQWSPQLYIRESYRTVNSFTLNENDLTAADGTTPRSTKTVGTVSYMVDSHHNEGLADPNGGTPRIWNEGNINVTAGGTDQIAPLPIEAFLPNQTDMENLVMGWCGGMSHLGFGGYRLELAGMSVAESMGLAVAQAKANSNQALQALDYPTLRSSVLASPSLSGEVAPVLPQLN